MPSLTIAAVTGYDGYTQGSVYAINRSYHELKDRIPDIRCVLISPNKPQDLPSHIQHFRVAPFGYLEYNLFILYSLVQFVETDFCLVVQNDGWVLDGTQWRDEFFDYDYIGSPLVTHWASVWQGQPHQIKYQFLRPTPTRAGEVFYQAQNGGFSLRSLKLLEAPRGMGLNMEIMPPDLFSGSNDTHQLKWSPPWHHEDMFLSVWKRGELERYGIKFAPESLAMTFSTENPDCCENYGGSRDRLLGFHLSVVS
ncbi:DUF5672 family protein [Kingella negevensis]|uniref:DUF5672 domain-containing protein n=2 Tax=Kingella negevensis TaxID=1522312 RepID=A0A238HIS6_9NEIS|nr:DUF5672 family protein [Kingella negevensis]MDK4696874.1 DUF5672 family protein [Kingella negevensis]MDK4708053.1 DUF5672 family protein [Kingella negevensis]MDK4709618.1 DUF5672 family protein [Kingella negevensis]SNB81323.1 Uncharacterised protein [Kingella negevensis]